MPDPDTRLYVQMHPDEKAVGRFVEIGRSLPRQRAGRLLPVDEIHLTLIHFGKTRDVLAAIRQVTPVSDHSYAANVKEYVRQTRRIMTDDRYRLTPQGYALFGARKTTLVARYEAPPELIAVHEEAYRLLLLFFSTCGMTDPDDFAAHDPNFRFARKFNPHVTIYKGYAGELPAEALPTIDATFMKLVY